MAARYNMDPKIVRALRQGWNIKTKRMSKRAYITAFKEGYRLSYSRMSLFRALDGKTYKGVV